MHPPCISSDTAFSAVALSILPAIILNSLYERIDRAAPEELFAEVLRTYDLTVVPHVAASYSGDVWVAAKKIISNAQNIDVKIIHYWDETYPKLLREIKRPPLVLYVKGNPIFENTISIVGTRDTDDESYRIAHRIAFETAQSGCSIVSGMAAGIDRAAHSGALDAGGATIGVLALGIDLFYPMKNIDLHDRVLGSPLSGLVSEYPAGVHADKWTFVRRNRIISGLSEGTVVVKAGAKSGALITAQYALEQGRGLCVCPGRSFDDGYKGCNELIRNGAAVVSSTEDIFKELVHILVKEKTAIQQDVYNMAEQFPRKKNQLLQKIVSPQKPAVSLYYKPDSPEYAVLTALSSSPMTSDQLCMKTLLPIECIHETVMQLQLDGAVSCSGNTIERIEK